MLKLRIKSVTTWQRKLLCSATLAALCLGMSHHSAFAQAVTSAPGGGSAAAINYGNATPMALPQSTLAPPSLLDVLLSGQSNERASAGSSPGHKGNGQMQPVRLAAPRTLSDSGVGSEQFGTSNHVFTTARVNANGNQTSRFYPYSAAGKLFFNIGTSTFVCSATLIKRGIIVTAAHCLANFGARQFYTNWRFVPAYNNGSAPFGTWTAANAYVLTSYFQGTEACATRGIVCPNDVGVIVLNPQSRAYPGTSTGWMGYGWNGYGFNSANQALISQLGYPVASDGGLLMQRTDSQGFVAASLSGNTVIGSLQTGGSSGGGWVANLGIPPSLSGTAFGSEAAANTVVGVTSWGYVSTVIKQQGASPFTDRNIVVLVNAACSFAPAACA